MTRSAVCALGALLVAGCGGTTYVNKKYRSKYSARSARLVIMPVEAHRFPRKLRPGIESLLNRELNNAFGSRGLLVLHVKSRLPGAGFANLGWRLALGTHYRAKVWSDPKLVGDYYDWLDELPEDSRRFVKWLKGAHSGAPGADHRFILTAYVERIANKKSKKGEPLITYRALAAIYDVRRARTVAAFWNYLESRPTLEHVLPKLKGFAARAKRAFGPVY